MFEMNIYIAAGIGLCLGFGIGQVIIYMMLADTPKEELQENKKLKIQYGLINWAVALLGALIASYLYRWY